MLPTRNVTLTPTNICAKSLTMYLFIVTLFSVLNTAISHGYNNYQKCCDSSSYLKKTNTTYRCIRTDQKRMQFLTNETGYLSTNESGFCVDTSDQFALFKVGQDEIQEYKLIETNIFPKCCPLDSYYDADFRSCVETGPNILSKSFITEEFVKIGLPECKVIIDHLLSENDFVRNDSLYLLNTNEYFSKGKFCIDKNENESFVARVCYTDSSICDQVKCLRKCCPDGQSFIQGSNCVDTYSHGFRLDFTERILNKTDPFALVHGRTCSRIHILNESRYIFYIDEYGALSMYYNKSDDFKKFPVDQEIYCIEHALSGKKINEFLIFKCYDEIPQKVKFTVSKWAKSLSCIFLVLTIIVYTMLTEIRNLFGKTLISYCLAVLILFIALTYSQFNTLMGDSACVIIGYITICGAFSGFTWLNIMCFDIWWTFGSPKSFIGIQQRKKELKRFLFYNLYGWGVPLFFLLLILIFNKTEALPRSIHPFVGKYKCYIEKRDGNYADILFIFVPLLIIQLINTALFFKTVVYCMKVKNEIIKMNDTNMSKGEKSKNFQADKERLLLLFKLSVIMGISYIFEVVSPFIPFEESNWKYVEVVWDTINCLQGVFIFIIFICKRKVYQAIRGKFGQTKLRKISTSSTMATQLSTVPQYKSENKKF